MSVECVLERRIVPLRMGTHEPRIEDAIGF